MAQLLGVLRKAEHERLLLAQDPYFNLPDFMAFCTNQPHISREDFVDAARRLGVFDAATSGLVLYELLMKSNRRVMLLSEPVMGQFFAPADPIMRESLSARPATGMIFPDSTQVRLR